MWPRARVGARVMLGQVLAVGEVISSSSSSSSSSSWAGFAWLDFCGSSPSTVLVFLQPVTPF